MGTLGKVLAVLNVLAAIVFLWLAAMDYGKRQMWTFHVQQQDFMIHGLPVDEKETDADGRPLVDLLGKRMQQNLFSGVQGQPVLTQVEEVKAWQQNLRKEIDDAADDAAKRKRLEEIVVPLARTWGERDGVRRRIRDTENKIDQLITDEFDGTFRLALDQERSLDGRRQAIAHILFNEAAKPEDRQRAVVIVGLEAYTQAGNSQAAALQAMVPEIEAVMTSEQTAFENEHRAVIQQIVTLAARVRDAEESHQKQVQLREQHKALVQARQEDVNDVKGRIEATKKATAEALATQTQLEQALFDAQRGVGTTMEKNQQLEQQLKMQEQGSLGGEMP